MILKAKHSGLYSEVVKVTPEMARELLDRNPANRKISEKQTDKWAAEMMRSAWRADNGESIKIDKKGNLKDGQHRLSAILKINKAVEIYVTFNVAEDCFETLDSGKTRSGADRLSIGGVKNEYLTAAALSLCFSHFELGNIMMTAKPTNAKIMELYERHKGIEKSVSFFTQNCKNSRVMPSSCVVFLHYLLSKKDREQAEVFLDAVCNGSGIPKGSMLFKLRERFIQDLTTRYKIPKLDKMGMCIKVWNAQRSGKSISCLKFASWKEEFPKVI